MKTARLLLYAYFREKIGRDELRVPLEGGDTVEDMYFWVCRHYPQAAFPMACLRFAVNGEYANRAQTLAENDEVVLIPPVAGG